MRLKNHEVHEVNIYQSITWAATFAIKEAIVAGWLTEQQANHLIDRMNTIMELLTDGKIVEFDPAKGTFQGHDISEATQEDETAEPDVLVIKGGQ